MCVRGVVRRVWAPRGEGVRQRLDSGRECRPLLVAGDPITGDLEWHRPANLTAASLQPYLERWHREGVRAVIWDNSGPHQHLGKQVFRSPTGLVLVGQPPNSPELNPAERLIEAVRAETEGRPYRNVESKVAAVEGIFNRWSAWPEQVKRLMDWPWLHEALLALPP